MEGYKPQDFSFFHRSEKLVQHADKHGLSGLMIIFPNGANVNDTNTMEFLMNDRIEYIVSGNLGANRSLNISWLGEISDIQ